MELLKSLFEFILHIDKHLVEIVSEYQTWTYLILFLIVFCETGLVVTPFLPGDSLLFAAGSIAALEGSPLHPLVLALVFFCAAFAGDNTNYFIGKYLEHQVKRLPFFNQKYLDQTHAFYEKHGGKTVIIARFVPLVRTFAPFVAGIGSMKYPRFILFSMTGTFLWITIFVTAGYLFGQMEIIRNHFSLVTLAIIGLSVAPIIIGLLKQKFSASKK